jgi:hypothetical protein
MTVLRGGKGPPQHIASSFLPIGFLEERDMWGYDEAEPRVFVENKFWAGLTENQPVSYLQQLAKYRQPTILLVVVPEAREQTLWREINRRLKEAGILPIDQETAAGGLVLSISTEIGPIIAITTWTRLLSVLELEVADDPSTRSDLLQLRALCEAADNDAFVPISSAEVSDRRTPAFILQLTSIWQACVDLAVTENILTTRGLLPQASSERIGRYVRFGEKGVVVWLGIHFVFWKKHGETPLWLLFPEDQIKRFPEVRPLLESWAAKEGILLTFQNDELAVGVDIALGEDKDQVVRYVVDCLKRIAGVLSVLKPLP